METIFDLELRVVEESSSLSESTKYSADLGLFDGLVALSVSSSPRPRGAVKERYVEPEWTNMDT